MPPKTERSPIRDSSAKEIDQRMEMLLKTTPSGPDFSQSTIGFCSRCVSTALAKSEKVALACCPDLSHEVEKRIDTMDFPLLPPITECDFVPNGSRGYLKTPKGNVLGASDLIISAHEANPHMVVFEYARKTYADTREYARTHTQADQKLPWFASRFKRIVGTYEEEPDMRLLQTPTAQFLAAAYLTEAGKVVAVEHSKGLIKRVRALASMGNNDQTLQNLERTARDVLQIRKDQAYVDMGLKTMAEIAGRACWNSGQTQLLLDMAFMRKDAFGNRDAVFGLVFAPLVAYVQQGRWEEALKHRDFLLKYFAGSFPLWRIRDLQTPPITQSMLSLITLIADNKINIEDVPNEELKQFLSQTQKRAESLAVRQARQVLGDNVYFSTNYFAKALLEGNNKPKGISYSYATSSKDWEINVVYDEGKDAKGHLCGHRESLGLVLYRVLTNPGTYQITPDDVKQALSDAIKEFESDQEDKSQRVKFKTDHREYLKSVFLCAGLPLESLTEPRISQLLS